MVGHPRYHTIPVPWESEIAVVKFPIVILAVFGGNVIARKSYNNCWWVAHYPNLAILGLGFTPLGGQEATLDNIWMNNCVYQGSKSKYLAQYGF